MDRNKCEHLANYNKIINFYKNIQGLSGMYPAILNSLNVSWQSVRSDLIMHEWTDTLLWSYSIKQGETIEWVCVLCDYFIYCDLTSRIYISRAVFFSLKILNYLNLLTSPTFRTDLTPCNISLFSKAKINVEMLWIKLRKMRWGNCWWQSQKRTL